MIQNVIPCSTCFVRMCVTCVEELVVCTMMINNINKRLYCMDVIWTAVEKRKRMKIIWIC